MDKPGEPTARDLERTKSEPTKAAKLDQLIIDRLLAKYEKSAHFLDGASSNRRVLLKLGPRSRDLREYDIESIERKSVVHAAIMRLKEQGLLDFAWERFNVGNVMASAWLCLDRVEDAYAFVGRLPKRAVVDRVIDHVVRHYMACEELTRKAAGRVSGEVGKTEPNSTMRFVMATLKSILELQATSGDVSPLLPTDPDIAINVVNALSRLPFMEPTYVRLFSIQCFNDSKYFERHIQAPLVSLARRFHPVFSPSFNPSINGDVAPSAAADAADAVDAESEAMNAALEQESASGIALEQEAAGGIPSASVDEILNTLGIFRNPEIYEFCGYVKLTFDGTTVDYIAFPFGACLHSSSLTKLTAVDAHRISRLLFIENRTNYEAYINGEHQSEALRTSELVVYHGGFHGPAKARFFRALILALPATASVFHWGDIDLGGLRIFMQIRQAIAPSLQPWRMDARTLHENKAKAIPYSETYRIALEKAHVDPAFQDFRELIAAMLETGLRLEQEALI